MRGRSHKKKPGTENVLVGTRLLSCFSPMQYWKSHVVVVSSFRSAVRMGQWKSLNLWKIVFSFKGTLTDWKVSWLLCCSVSRKKNHIENQYQQSSSVKYCIYSKTHLMKSVLFQQAILFCKWNIGEWYITEICILCFYPNLLIPVLMYCYRNTYI